ncbi:hypothetical protein CsSME_00039401 [Camellia sinensis var. sinensis]
MDIHYQHPSHDLMSSSKQAQVVVIMASFPLQSHLNQLLLQHPGPLCLLPHPHPPGQTLLQWHKQSCFCPNPLP